MRKYFLYSYLQRNQFGLNLLLKVILSFFILTGSAWLATSQETNSYRPDIVAVYYPHWHSYDHGSTWKGEGWTEWDDMKAALPRFPGHHQPKQPSWGCFDESDPNWVEKEINLAADNGIDVFLYDWYWYNGVQTMEEALEQGFLRAVNRNRMKFALMWANHHRRDQWYPELGATRTIYMYSRHSSNDLKRVIDYCIDNYFCHPNYWRVNDSLFFSIFWTKEFIEQLGGPTETRKLFQEIDQQLHRAGFPPMHWSAMVSNPEMASLAKQAGFASTSRYNVSTAGKVKKDFTEEYEDVMEAHRVYWEKMTNQSPLVNMPVVTMGWDSSPRCKLDEPFPWAKNDYPYGHIVVGNTPERFERLLYDAKKHVANDPHNPYGILINAWNEWTEGCYILPEKRYGEGYVEAVKKVFGESKF